MNKILVTGAAGYIGSVLVRQLLKKGYAVKGFDILNFGGESLVDVYSEPKFEFVRGDIRNRDAIQSAVRDVDAVVHLAAIVGDPACAQQPAIARDTNWTASRDLFDMCSQERRVKRFVFASTCSNYGKMDGDDYVTENSPLRPVSLYAELKVEFERYLLGSQVRQDFAPTALRFSTVYGLSPRLRFDLTVNEFVREIAMGKELQIFGEQFWRPYCHVQDLAGSCILVLESAADKVRQNVFNVGDTSENYNKRMIADEITKLVPTAKIKYIHKDEDPRNYRVDFSKIKNELGFNISKTLVDGIREIYKLLVDGILRDPYSNSYKNI
jgi:nucleoside-diphosphate-sugar epimerase